MTVLRREGATLRLVVSNPHPVRRAPRFDPLHPPSAELLADVTDFLKTTAAAFAQYARATDDPSFARLARVDAEVFRDMAEHYNDLLLAEKVFGPPVTAFGPPGGAVALHAVINPHEDSAGGHSENCDSPAGGDLPGAVT